MFKNDGSTIVFFSKSKQGLYFYALRNDTKTNAKTKKIENDTTFNKVQENKNKNSKRDVSRTTLAWKRQRSIGGPSLQKYIKILEKNLLPN